MITCAFLSKVPGPVCLHERSLAFPGHQLYATYPGLPFAAGAPGSKIIPFLRSPVSGKEV